MFVGNIVATINGERASVCERRIIPAAELGTYLANGWRLDGSSWLRDMSRCTVYLWWSLVAASDDAEATR